MDYNNHRKSIYKMNLLFNLTRRYVMFMFRKYYDNFIILGKENIPVDMPVIFAPNHNNALMDALAVHYIVPRNKSLVFLAKADLFVNKFVSSILVLSKILPAFRMRDGYGNLGRNAEVFDQCIEILHNNQALGIMPEGNQEIERKLRPFAKGIFRVAFEAQKKYGISPNVNIIPVGIDFGDILKSHKHIIINIGQPIEISDYMSLYSENPIKAINEIKGNLHNRLSKLTLDLATDKHYKCFETVVEILQGVALEKFNLTDNTENRFHVRQKLALRLIKIEKKHINEIIQIDLLSSRLTEILNQLNIKHNQLIEKESSGLDLIVGFVFLVFTFPVFVVGFILNIIPFFSPVYIRKYILKTKYVGFFSSVHFGLSLFSFPLFYGVQTLLFGLIVNCSWWAVIIFLFAQYPLGNLALSWYKGMIKLKAKFQLLQIKKHQSKVLTDAHRIYNELVNLVFSE